METITQANFDALNAAQKLAVSNNPEVTIVAEETVSVFEAGTDVMAEAKPETSYDIEGDTVYLNVTVMVNGHKLHLRGVKLTEKSTCMEKWDKESKSWKQEHAPTMSLINAVRTHGSDKVNDAMTVEANVKIGGESSSVEIIDLFA